MDNDKTERNNMNVRCWICKKDIERIKSKENTFVVRESPLGDTYYHIDCYPKLLIKEAVRKCSQT